MSRPARCRRPLGAILVSEPYMSGVLIRGGTQGKQGVRRGASARTRGISKIGVLPVNSLKPGIVVKTNQSSTCCEDQAPILTYARDQASIFSLLFELVPRSRAAYRAARTRTWPQIDAIRIDLSQQWCQQSTMAAVARSRRRCLLPLRVRSYREHWTTLTRGAVQEVCKVKLQSTHQASSDGCRAGAAR